MLPQQQPVPVCMPVFPHPAPASPHILGRTLSLRRSSSPTVCPTASVCRAAAATRIWLMGSSCSSRRAAGTGPGAACSCGGSRAGVPPFLPEGGKQSHIGAGGQAQIGTVWVIEAPLSGGLWRARQPFLRGRKRRLEPDWPGGPRAGGRKRGRKRAFIASVPAVAQLQAAQPPHDPPASVPCRPVLCHSLGVAWMHLARCRGRGCCCGAPCPLVPICAQHPALGLPVLLCDTSCWDVAGTLSYGLVPGATLGS